MHNYLAGNSRADEHYPVLIVGGGYAGTAAALFLAWHGISALLVDRHDQPRVQGRARGINQRTMELYRPLGITAEITRAAEPFAADAGVARCRALAAEWEWLFDPEPDPRLKEISPAGFTMADQGDVEPILTARAVGLGARIERGVTAEDVQVTDEGVRARLLSGPAGAARTVTAEYLVVADGQASPLRDALGIVRDGPGVTQHWMSIVFDADLTALTARRALFWIVLNEELGFASLTTTATRDRWSLGVTYDPANPGAATFGREHCLRLIRQAVGLPALEAKVIDVTAWQQAVGVARRYRQGRAFLVGDAAHVWPPAGAMGANSAIQDAHNLAWKLAHVLAGRAGEGLLDSYADERLPVATALADLTVRRQAARFSGGLDDDVDDIVCTFGQRYQSAAILGPGTGAPFGGEVAGVAEPGARMPHAWLDPGHSVSTHDLVAQGFLVISGSEGGGWAEAAAAAGLDTRRVPDQVLPARGTAALVRPDGYVAWLAGQGRPSAARLREAVAAVLQAPFQAGAGSLH